MVILHLVLPVPRTAMVRKQEFSHTARCPGFRGEEAPVCVIRLEKYGRHSSELKFEVLPSFPGQPRLPNQLSRPAQAIGPVKSRVLLRDYSISVTYVVIAPKYADTSKCQLS